VVSAPTLTGVAGGTLATSSVTYNAPVLDVTLPGGTHVTLDASHTGARLHHRRRHPAAAALLTGLDLPLLDLLPSAPDSACDWPSATCTSRSSPTRSAAYASMLRLGVSLVAPDLPLAVPSLPVGAPDLPARGSLAAGGRARPVGGRALAAGGRALAAVGAAHLPVAAPDLPVASSGRHRRGLLDLDISALKVTAGAPAQVVPCGYSCGHPSAAVAAPVAGGPYGGDVEFGSATRRPGPPWLAETRTGLVVGVLHRGGDGRRHGGRPAAARGYFRPRRLRRRPTGR